jgi:hypothetical protein
MLEESYWNGFRRWLSSYLLRQPGIVAFWEENKGGFGDEFIAYADSLLEEREARRDIKTEDGAREGNHVA